MNKYVMMFIVFLLLEVSLCTILEAIISTDIEWKTYLGESAVIGIREILYDFLAFTLLFNYIVPISLYVTLGNVRRTGLNFRCMEC